MDNETRRLSRLYRNARESTSSCPDGRVLARLADGSAWPWQRRRVSGHLAECAHCADEYRALLVARDGLRRALDLPERADGSPRTAGAGWQALLAPAVGAAVVIAAVASVVMIAPGPGSSGAPEQVVGAAPETIFVSDFGAGKESAPDSRSGGDMLFRSDFGETRNG